MARNAEKQAGSSLKMKKPQRGNAEASGNEINFGEEIVMSKNTTAVSNVIPFKFDKQEVRTLLIDEQPWFVAADVSQALEYRIAGDMTRNLDDDEKGTQIVRTLGGEQEMLIINESGLYSAILRSRKAEAKRFKKWVTAEVLPAIRKQGRYEDANSKMTTLMDELIGMTEANALKGLTRHKVACLPSSVQRSASARIYSAVHTRFNVPRIELIPAAQFDQACNFIAAYVVEGEWLPKQESAGVVVLDAHAAQHVYLLMSRIASMNKHRDSLGSAARSLDSKPLMSVYSQLLESRSSFGYLDAYIGKDIYNAYRSLGAMDGGYAAGAAA